MKKPSRKISAINVVPYLDVMLVLLVIFMITAPLFTLGELELPEVGGVAPKTAEFQIAYKHGGDPGVCGAPDAAGEITCRTGGDILLSKDGGKDSPPLGRDELVERLQQECTLKSPDAPKKFNIALAADERVFYGEITDLMETIRGSVKCPVDFSLLVEPAE